MPIVSTRPGRDLWRAGLYGAKPAFVARLRRIEDAASRRGVSADTVTVVGVAVGVLTGAALLVGSVAPLALLAVAPLCLIRMACNAIDGSLARRHGTTSRRGAVLNELGDRVADAVTLAALAPAVGPVLAVSVVLVALATSFVAVVGQATTGQRVGAGPMGKPDRVALLSVAAAFAAFTGPVALVAGAWALIVAGVLTIARRTVTLWQRAGHAT